MSKVVVNKNFQLNKEDKENKINSFLKSHYSKQEKEIENLLDKQELELKKLNDKQVKELMEIRELHIEQNKKVYYKLYELENNVIDEI
jgi:hypothetical protein